MKNDCLSRRMSNHLGDDLFGVGGSADIEFVADDPACVSADYHVDLANLEAIFELHQNPLRVDRSAGAADSYGYRLHHAYCSQWSKSGTSRLIVHKNPIGPECICKCEDKCSDCFSPWQRDRTSR